MREEKVTVKTIAKKYARGERLVMVTAYDYPTARIVDEAGVDIILVGDSAAMVVHGMESTRQIGLEEMILHVRAVARAKPRAMIVADMPFGSYEKSREQAVETAVRLVKAGADAVKLEGGVEVEDRIRSIVEAGIPVMGHVGLTPQRSLLLGGYRPRGKKRVDAERILEDALAVERAGAFSLVVEFTSEELARIITGRIGIPTICIGSGRYCSGQVLVFHDIVGLSEATPPFAKRYVDAWSILRDAVARYAEEVRKGAFPGSEHVFHAKEDLPGLEG